MMLELEGESWDETLNPQLRGLQVIVSALAAGALSFLLITAFMAPSIGLTAEAETAQGSPVILYIGLAAAVLGIMARMVIPNAIEAAGRRALAAEPSTHPGTPAERSDLNGRLLALYQRRLIVAAALIEGPTFLLITAYMLEHSKVALILAVAMIVLIALHVPTQARVSNWLAEQRKLVEEQRALIR
ncbi:MAG: hypothetical protein K8T91_02215 [Planctomycetes bacterium]|nr:hypothetical protein [Planctomycetota bacterium]